MISEQENTKEDIRHGEWLFSGESKFLIGSTDVSNLPLYDISEVAFIGSSNVGKSSLINSILGRKKLARTSNTPGHTRQLNFFLIRDKLILVDFPGYGYAKVSKSEVANWKKFSISYLKGRVELKRVFLLIDVRRGVRKNDENIMKILDNAAVTYQIILTKVDKIKDIAVTATINSISSIFNMHAALYPYIILTSSKKLYGFENLRAEISRLVFKE